ncbi:MAG: glycosyltransferase family 2 protein [Methylacidiphilales bacterium]|nr:glycosyltransferase family 2 protein [Candidatus Methylacidiphilales bacterium]
MKISIITPSRNHGDALEATIRSVMNQSLSEVEHIVVDAASTDNTLEVLARYPHVRYISERDNGFEEAFNKGLDMATGTYVACCNIWDEYIDPNWLQDATGVMDSQPDVSMVSGRFVELDALNHEVRTAPYDWFVTEAPQKEAGLYYYLFNPWPAIAEVALVAPKETFLRCFPRRRVVIEDRDVWFDFLNTFYASGHLAVFLPRTAISTRSHDDSRILNQLESGIFRRIARSYTKHQRRLRYGLLFGRQKMIFRDRGGNPLPVKFRFWRFWYAFLDFKIRMFWFKKIMKGKAGWKHPDVNPRMISASLRRAGLMKPGGG